VPAAAFLAARLPAQALSRTSGAVVRVFAGDTVAVPGVRVQLHQVGRTVQGAVDSLRSDPRGRFRFTFRRDSTAAYLLSARWSGIEYFSAPVATDPVRPDTGIRLVVYDTSSAAAVASAHRTLLVSAPDPSGTRSVVDWFVIANGGGVTRVERDSLTGTWGAPLPAGLRGAQVGDPGLSQFSPDAVRFRHDSVLVVAPLSPGEKELLIEYQLPRRRRQFSVPLGRVDSADVLLEEPGARVATPGWVVTDSQSFEGRRFRRHARRDRGSTLLTIRFPGWSLPPGVTLAALVGGLAAALALAGWGLLRRSRAPMPAGGTDDPLAVADRIAALDAAHDGREGEVAPAWWARYRAERAELKRRLEHALARAARRS